MKSCDIYVETADDLPERCARLVGRAGKTHLRMGLVMDINDPDGPRVTAIAHEETALDLAQFVLRMDDFPRTVDDLDAMIADWRRNRHDTDSVRIAQRLER